MPALPQPPETVVLAARQLWSCGSRGIRAIRCAKGVVWLTCGDGVDHVLEAGGRWRVARRGWIVVEALAPSILVVERPRPTKGAGAACRLDLAGDGRRIGTEGEDPR